jgi:addiction module HigA family antidote
MTADTIMPPVHPGEILLTEFLEPLELSQYRLARSIAVPARRINEIVHGQRRISADTALRLARFFGTSERFWMNLQSRYDLEIEKDRLGPVLDSIQPLTAASLRRPDCLLAQTSGYRRVSAGKAAARASPDSSKAQRPERPPGSRSPRRGSPGCSPRA